MVLMDEKVEVVLKGNEFTRVMQNTFDNIKKKYDLKKVDIEVLLYLSTSKEQNTPTDIHSRMKINRGHISQSIDRLIKKGYLIAAPDADDRRSMHYSVSEKADSLICEIKSQKQDLEKRIFEGITEEEVTIYKNITYKIISNLNKMI